jgi:hypothetical protein
VRQSRLDRRNTGLSVPLQVRQRQGQNDGAAKSNGTSGKGVRSGCAQPFNAHQPVRAPSVSWMRMISASAIPPPPPSLLSLTAREDEGREGRGSKAAQRGGKRGDRGTEANAAAVGCRFHTPNPQPRALSAVHCCSDCGCCCAPSSSLRRSVVLLASSMTNECKLRSLNTA